MQHLESSWNNKGEHGALGGVHRSIEAKVGRNQQTERKGEGKRQINIQVKVLTYWYQVRTLKISTSP